MTLPRDLRLCKSSRGLRLRTTLPDEVWRFVVDPGVPSGCAMLVGLFEMLVGDVVTEVEFSSPCGDLLIVTFDRGLSQIICCKFNAKPETRFATSDSEIQWAQAELPRNRAGMEQSELGGM